MKKLILILSLSLVWCFPAHAFELTQEPVRDNGDCRGDWFIKYKVQIPSMGNIKDKILNHIDPVKPEEQCWKLGICSVAWCIPASDANAAQQIGDQYAYKVEHPEPPKQEQIDALTAQIAAQKIQDDRYTRMRTVQETTKSTFVNP